MIDLAGLIQAGKLHECGFCGLTTIHAEEICTETADLYYCDHADNIPVLISGLKKDLAAAISLAKRGLYTDGFLEPGHTPIVICNSCAEWHDLRKNVKHLPTCEVVIIQMGDPRDKPKEQKP